MHSNEFSGKRRNFPNPTSGVSRNQKSASNEIVLITATSITLLITFFVTPTWSGYVCMENPCLHGICIDSLQINSSHQCYCRNGYTGYSCQKNWDECQINPCLNGGVCLDGIASFNCSCPENFAGTLCEVDLSICEEVWPCQNNGTCILDTGNVTGSGFKCSCTPGFTGYQCEIDISVCNATENVCLNGGKCVDGLGNRFRCECEPGWSGDTCDQEINECDSQPCLNEGVCVNKINDFSCACPFGYTGKSCETKLRICEENPCQNGGFCLHEQQMEESDTERTCFCVPDFHGTLCEFRYNDCEPAPKCFNGGTCIDGVGDFSCSCPPDFFGPTCQCTADNATEPECSLFGGNGTAVTPTPSLPIPGDSISQIITTNLEFSSTWMVLESHPPPLSPSTKLDILSTPVDTSSPETPSPSTFDPGGGLQGRDDLESSPVSERPQSTLQFPEESLISVPASSVAPVAESTAAVVTFEPSSSPTPTIRLDGSEETLSLLDTPTQTTAIPAATAVPPMPSPLPSSLPSDSLLLSSEYGGGVVEETTRIELQPTPSATIFPGDGELSTLIVLPPAINTADLHYTANLETEVGIVTPTITAFPSPSPTQPTEVEPTAKDIGPPDESKPSEELSPSLPPVPPTTPIPTPEPSESVFVDIVTSSFLMDSISIPTPQISSEEILFPGATLSPASSPLASQPPASPTISPSPTTSIPDDLLIVTATPTFPTTLSPEPETNVTVTSDPCLNYCHNDAKCIAISIEPICVCSFKFTGDRCELPREPFRSASFSGDSFLSFRVPNDSFIGKVDIRAQMVTIIPEGILLYTGVGKMYALIFTQNGHVTLHFSCGSQSMRFVETRTRVDNGFNFTLDFRMEMIVDSLPLRRCSAEVSVNGSYVMKGEQVMGPAVSDGQGHLPPVLEHGPIETVFLGGVQGMQSSSKFNDDLLGILPGFRGCLHHLRVNQEVKSIYEDATDGKEVAECASFGCVANPCHGTARCVTTHAFPFWECICGEGYKGHRCQIIQCTKNPCLNGATCTYSEESLNLIMDHHHEDFSQEVVNEVDLHDTTISPIMIREQLPHICLCPLGFTGSLCEKRMNVSKPAFSPLSGYSSFMAYEPIPRFIDWFQLKFHFVTKNISQIALMLYSGNDRGPQPLQLLRSSPPDTDFSMETTTENSIGNGNGHTKHLTGFDQTMAVSHPEPVSDFFAITFLQGFIALTWNLGSGTQRITTPSRIDNRLNIHTLFAGRNGRQAWLKVDGMRNVTGKTPGPLYRLNAESNELYIGGYKSFKFEGLSHDLPLHQGFQGCIFDLGFRVKNRLYLPRAMGGRNVKNCFEEDC